MTLPPLPAPARSVVYNESKGYGFYAYTAAQMENYARAAIAAHVPEAGCGNIAAVPAQPPAPNPWREAIDTALITSGLDCLGPQDQPKEAVQRLIEWEHKLALDPAISAEAAALLNQRPPAPTAQPDSEADELQALNDKLSSILSRTAVALRGPEPPLTRWSWHDLPERAAAAIAAIDVMQRAAQIAAQPVQQPGAEPDEFLGLSFNEAKARILALDADSARGIAISFMIQLGLLQKYAAPAQRQPLTVPALTDAQMSECAWGYVADSRNLDAGVTGIIQATQLACAAAWGVTLAAQKGEKL